MEGAILPFDEQLTIIRLLTSQLAHDEQVSAKAITQALTACEVQLRTLLVEQPAEGSVAAVEAPAEEEDEGESDADDDDGRSEERAAAVAGGYSEESDQGDEDASEILADEDPFSGSSAPVSEAAMPAIDELFGQPKKLAAATASLADELFGAVPARPPSSDPADAPTALHLADDIFGSAANRAPPQTLPPQPQSPEIMRDHTRPDKTVPLAENGGVLRNAIFDDLLSRPAASHRAGSPPPRTPRRTPSGARLREEESGELDHLLFLVHGIGQHEDFCDDKLVAWDGSTEKLWGGNHEFRENLEKVSSNQLRGTPLRLTVRFV